MWSPTLLENPAPGCLDSRSWNQSASVPTAANSYQNFSGFYSNMDYLGSSVQQQLVSYINLNLASEFTILIQMRPFSLA